MATPPANVIAFRASSVLDQTPKASTQQAKPALAGAPSSILTRQWVQLRRVLFTKGDLADVDKLFDLLNRFQESILSVLGVVTTNQLIPGNILRNVAMNSAGTYYLAHGLGRPWQGYFIVRNYQGSAYGALRDIALPQGMTADKILAVQSQQTGTFDIYVF